MTSKIGLKFNNLEIIETTGEHNSDGSIIYKCKCKCGKTYLATIIQLRKKIVSCCFNKQSKRITNARKNIGRKFGRLEIIDVTEQRSHNHIVYKCKCDCGNEYFSIITNLKNGSTKSCGCLQEENYINLKMDAYNKAKENIGLKFGRLEIINVGDTQESDGSFLYHCLCDCGNFHTATITNMKRGQVKSCGCLLNDPESISKTLSTKLENGIIYEPMIATARKIWLGTYSDGDLTFEKFMELSQMKCAYCGATPSNNSNMYRYKGSRASAERIKNGDFIYNGLDRIDSSIGHNLNNVVPCCAKCNYFKSDYSVEEFLNQVKKIYEFSIGGLNQITPKTSPHTHL